MVETFSEYNYNFDSLFVGFLSIGSFQQMLHLESSIYIYTIPQLFAFSHFAVDKKTTAETETKNF